MEAVRAVCILLAFAGVLVPCLSVDHPVSWSQGVDYTTWSHGKTINAGDTLTFTYASFLHNVDMLGTKSDYDSCNTKSPVKSDSSGSTKITLDKPSTTYYFACGTVGHCTGGMKMAVTTANDGTSAGSSPTTLTSSTPTTSTSRSGAGLAAVAGGKAVLGTAMAAAGLALLC